MAPITRKKKKRTAKQNGSWFAKLSADDKAEVRAGWIENGKKISDSIMSNPEERKRRASMLKEMWDEPDKAAIFRENQSETAKKTSARADVQDARAERLKNWRDNNPEDFYNKCTSKAFSCAKRKTKPEKFFHKHADKSLKEFSFKYSQSLFSETFENKSKRRQIDFISSNRMFWIEIDGPLHFKKDFKGYNEILKKDIAVDLIAKSRKKILIRISFDQWDVKTGIINTVCLNKVKEILDNGVPGVYYLGKKYLEKNILTKE